jgi:hypothetical protein
MTFALQCLEVLAQARDSSAQKKRLERACQECAKNNHSVG